MNKRHPRKNGNRKANGREWPFVVYLWTLGLGLAGYLVVGRLFLGKSALTPTTGPPGSWVLPPELS